MKKSGGKTMSSKQTRRMRRQFLKHHAVLLGILDKNLQSRFNPPLFEKLHLDDTDRLIVLSTE